MAITIYPAQHALLLALTVLVRATFGLLAHGLLHPGEPGRMCRRSGRVFVR